jgi:hypothetical protein
MKMYKNTSSFFNLLKATSDDRMRDDHITCSYMTGTSGDDDLLLLSELEDLSKERPANVLNIPNDIFLRALSNVLNAAVLLVDCVNVPKRNSLC